MTASIPLHMNARLFRKKAKFFEWPLNFALLAFTPRKANYTGCGAKMQFVFTFQKQQRRKKPIRRILYATPLVKGFDLEQITVFAVRLL